MPATADLKEGGSPEVKRPSQIQLYSVAKVMKTRSAVNNISARESRRVGTAFGLDAQTATSNELAGK
jgi:hypothetical protein